MKNGRTLRLVAVATSLTLCIAHDDLVLSAACIVMIGVMRTIVVRAVMVRIDVSIEGDCMQDAVMTAVRGMGVTGRSSRYAETRKGQRKAG